MTRAGALAAVLVVVAGCATSRSGDDLRGILTPSVQLRAERGGVRKSGSGVVIAVDAAARRSWIVTTRHLFEPQAPQRLWVQTTDDRRRLPAVVRSMSPDADLALVEVEGRVLVPASLQDTARLGLEIRVVAFPWGRSLTVVSGIVSQISSEEDAVAVEGAVRMIDASVSYGASGGGVFDATTGTLVGIVESYRTARLTLPTDPEKTLDMPVPGETTVISAPAIRRFLSGAGVALPQ